ncbi:MAG: Dps family protein [Phormidium sp.]
MQAQPKSLPLNIGIDEEARQEIASGLSRLLADTYSLYLKTHYFHWNVTGPMFTSLHAMFELQYTELAAAVDIIAERIRSLGVFAPGSYSTFTELSSIPETKDVPNAEEMVRLLVEGNEAVAKTARSIFPAAERGDDQSTLDMLTQRLSVHEKTAWMLRSILTNQ